MGRLNSVLQKVYGSFRETRFGKYMAGFLDYSDQVRRVGELETQLASEQSRIVQLENYLNGSAGAVRHLKRALSDSNRRLAGVMSTPPRYEILRYLVPIEQQDVLLKQYKKYAYQLFMHGASAVEVQIALEKGGLEGVAEFRKGLIRKKIQERRAEKESV